MSKKRLLHWKNTKEILRFKLSVIVIFSEDKERKQQQTREKKINKKKQYNVENDVFYDAVQPKHTQKTTENKQTNKFVKFFEE